MNNPRLTSVAKTFLPWLVWSYAAGVLAAWQIMVVYGDRWWPATILLFSPRWLLALPLLVLFPLVLFFRRWLLVPLILTLTTILLPVMGLSGLLKKERPQTIGKPLRVVTCNLRSGEFDSVKLARMIRQTSADIVTLQECPPEQVLAAPAGWTVAQSRGFAILSRYPLKGLNFLTMTPPGEKWQWTYLLQSVVTTPGGDVAVCSLQLPTPRFGLQEILDRKTLIRPTRKGRLVRDTEFRRQAAGKLRDYAATLKLPVILAGDFNTPVESTIYREIWGGYANAFSTTGRGYGWTQRVTVKGFTIGVRIDHVLTSKELVPLVSEVGPDVDSDHLPLIADLGFVQ